MVNHDSCSVPSVFFVESRRSVVADRASEPSCLDAALRKSMLAVGQQSSCDAGASRFCRDEELIQLVARHDAEAKRRADWSDDAQSWQCCFQAFAEAFERARACELSGEDLGMCILPAVIPNLRQLVEL